MAELDPNAFAEQLARFAMPADDARARARHDEFRREIPHLKDGGREARASRADEAHTMCVGNRPLLHVRPHIRARASILQ